MALSQDDIRAVESIIDEIRSRRGLNAQDKADTLQALKRRAIAFLKPYPNQVLKAGKYYVSYQFMPPKEWGMEKRIIDLWDALVETHDKSLDRFHYNQISFIPDYPKRPI